MFIGKTGQKVLDISSYSGLFGSTQSSNVLSCSHDFDLFLCDFFAFLCPSCSVHSLLSLALHPEWWSKMLCTDMLVKDLHRLHVIANLYCTFQRWMAIVSVFPPSLKHQGQNVFSPTLKEISEHLKHHWNVALETHIGPSYTLFI